MKHVALASLIFVLAAIAPAGEVSSNGAGGGAWSDPATWRGKAVPKADDEVILIKGDTVVFDRNDEKVEKGTCKKLSLDPQSTLKFKSGAGKLVFVAAGPVECYGLIKMDASLQDADEPLELHLIAAKTEERVLKVIKGGGLQVLGKDKLKAGKKNVKLYAYVPFMEGDHTGKLDAGESSSLDLQHAEIENVQVYPSKIDNTGAKPNERMNILNNHFVGTSSLYAISCDTPVVTANVFDYTGASTLPSPAIVMNSCPLAEVKNNIVRGNYSIGIMGYGQEDGVTTGNVIEKCQTGFNWYGINAMLKNNTVRQCTTGFHFHSMSGAMEDADIDGCPTGILIGGATLQLATMRFKNIPKGGHAIGISSGDVTLINTDLKPEQIRQDVKATGMGKPMMTAYQCLVVKLDGAAPPDTQVELATINPVPPIAPGAIDLNIRNNPAPLVRGMTPLPQTLQPLIVRSWMIDNAGKPVAAPQYTLKVLAAADKPDGERKVLKTQAVKPDETWFRPKSDDPKPTLEVSLK